MMKSRKSYLIYETTDSRFKVVSTSIIFNKYKDTVSNLGSKTELLVA